MDVEAEAQGGVILAWCCGGRGLVSIKSSPPPRGGGRKLMGKGFVGNTNESKPRGINIL